MYTLKRKKNFLNRKKLIINAKKFEKPNIKRLPLYQQLVYSSKPTLPFCRITAYATMPLVRVFHTNFVPSFDPKE
jgi:hypothetical protein